jgi:hypothetical protein
VLSWQSALGGADAPTVAYAVISWGGHAS